MSLEPLQLLGSASEGGPAGAETQASISALPNELLQNICEFLELEDLVLFCATSRNFRSLLSDPETWRERVVEVPELDTNLEGQAAVVWHSKWLPSLPKNVLQIIEGGDDLSTLIANQGESLNEIWDSTLVIPFTWLTNCTLPSLIKCDFMVVEFGFDIIATTLHVLWLLVRSSPRLTSLHVTAIEPFSDAFIPSALLPIEGEPEVLNAATIFRQNRPSQLRQLSVLIVAPVDPLCLTFNVNFGEMFPVLESLMLPTEQIVSLEHAESLLRGMDNLRFLCVQDPSREAILETLLEHPDLVPNLTRLRIIANPHQIYDEHPAELEGLRDLFERYERLLASRSERGLTDIVLCGASGACIHFTLEGTTFTVLEEELDDHVCDIEAADPTEFLCLFENYEGEPVDDDFFECSDEEDDEDGDEWDEELDDYFDSDIQDYLDDEAFEDEDYNENWY